MTRPAILEALESRIAPALIVLNPIADIVVGAGHSGKTIELSQMFDPLLDSPGHTIVTFTLNFDSNPATPAIEPTQIRMELFDDEAPLTVQNFLRYLEGGNAAEFIDTFFHRSVNNFILQGGGFSATDIKNIDEHIDTFSTVHNEFSSDRSNLRGTIAMAKVETNENTASSEWFVNLADNSSNLDNQNGGFTVFGRIIEGMNVIDSIAALPKANLGGALGTVPVQKMNPDPDNNPNTQSPTPGKDNLIRVTGIDIAPPAVGQVQGISDYTVDVLDNEGNPNAVQATVDPVTGKLQLTYNPAQSGVATIVVTAQQGEDTATETFTVTVRPNLIATVTNDLLNGILLPGEGGKATFKVKNNGGANFSGSAVINFYLSSRDGQNGEDPNGTILDTEDDLLLLGGLNQTVTVNAAGEVELSANLTLPPDLIKGSIDDYLLLVEIKPAVGTTQELFTDDNVSVDGGVHLLTNQFGTLDFSSNGFGKRTNVKLNYIDPVTSQEVTLSIKGPGTGQVLLDEGDTEIDGDESAELLVTGTTLKSQLKIASGGAVEFGQIDVTSVIGKVDFGIVDKPGNVALSGGAKTVVFGDISNESRLTIGTTASGSGTPVSIKLGRVADLSVESSHLIKSLQAIDWRDTTGVDDSITAPALSSLKITGDKKGGVRGDFEANLETFTSAKLSKITVAGLVSNTTIHSHGDIGKVTVGGLINSNIFAGTDERPDSLTDFDTVQTIQSLTVKGVTGVTNVFVDSQVAAAVISKISVRGVDTASGDSAFGFVADKIGKYSRVDGPRFSNLTEPGTKDVVGNYQLLIL